MKKSFKVMMAGIVATMVISISGMAYANAALGSAGALADSEYTVEEMLAYAIQDEYAARASYQAVINTYGDQAPFTNIVKSEANHINRLSELFASLGYTEISLPGSLEEIYVAEVAMEENNIAMYEKFLKEELPSDVKLVFERLLKASKNHLKAFQNAVEGNVANCTENGTMRNGENRNGSCTGSGNGTCTGDGMGSRQQGGRGRGNRMSGNKL
jgi:hypothetical protein